MSGERQRIELPAAGLAKDILAQVRGAQAARQADPSPEPETPLHRFADRVRRDHEAPAPAPPETPEPWVVFELDDELFALPVTDVREVVRVDSLSRVPHAPFPVRGLTTLRGQVLVVLDLRQRLGLAEGPITAASRLLVVRSRGRAFGLLVDRVAEVERLLPSAMTDPPSDILSTRSRYLRGLYPTEEGLRILLHLERILEVGGTPSDAEEKNP